MAPADRGGQECRPTDANSVAVSVRRLVAVTAALAMAAAGMTAASATQSAPSACPTAQLQTITVPTTLKVDNHVNVLLPAHYCDNGRHYPVLYLLHGAGDTYATWADPAHGDAVNIAGGYPVIVVMPDAGHAPPGWYSDWVDGSYQWESFHIN